MKAAFKALAKKYHPDRFSDPHEKRQAEERMARINEAQQLLASGNYRPPPPPPPTPAPEEPVDAPPPRPAPPPPSASSPKPRAASPPVRSGPFVAVALIFLALLFLPGLLSSSHLEKALQYEEEGRFQDSLVYLNKAVAEDPHDRELYGHRARIWDKLGEPEKASVDRHNAKPPTLSFPVASPSPSASKVPDAPAKNSADHVP